MTRPLRQIDDRAVLDDPDRHWPARPSWTCEAGCGDWPCRPLRDHLHATMSPQDIALYMGTYARDAERELEGKLGPITVYARMFGWVRAVPRQHPPLRRPPGGPW